MTPHRRAAETPRAPEAPGTRVHRARRRLGRLAVFAAVTLAVLVAVSTVVNLALVRHERATIAPYGQRVPVEGGSVNVVDNGAEGPVIVLLGGLGSPAPGLEYAALARELDGYRVVVVEGFGYGYADPQGPKRTVENISQELHTALEAADVEEPYVLGGHSIAGFYLLNYVNRYPGEVSAVVGIDHTVPTATAEHGEAAPVEDEGLPWQRLPATTGLVRWVTLAAPGLAEPGSDLYTEEEKRRIRLMSNWNYENPALRDETRRLSQNSRALAGTSFPEDVPVLAVLAQDTIDQRSEWRPLHEDQLRAVRDHEIVVLDGPHFLHLNQAPELAATTTAFLEDRGIRPES